MIISAHRETGPGRPIKSKQMKKTEHYDPKRRQVCALFSAYHKLYSMYFVVVSYGYTKINRISRKLNNGRAYITFFGA